MAIIGAGFIADYHLQILREIPGVSVVGICDPNAERLAQVADRWSVSVRARDADELLERARPDVVHVLVPPSFHYEVSRQLIENGVHVLVEKPLTISSEESHALAVLAEENDVHLGVNHNWLYQPLFERALADIAARKIGPVQHVVSTNSLPLSQLLAGMHDHWMFQRPTNVLLEQLPHPMSQVCALIGGVTSAAVSRGQPRRLRTGSWFYPRWQMSLEGESASAQLSISFHQSFADAQLHIIGRDGAIHIDQFKNLYSMDRRTRYVEPIDVFARGARQAGNLILGASAQIARYSLSLLGMLGRNDTYYLGMKGSIAAFYRDLRNPSSEGKNLRIGLRTMDAVQRVVDDAERCGEPAVTLRAESSKPSHSTRIASHGKVLIIGANGFIGRKAVARFAERGYDVRAMVRSPKRVADLVDRYGIEVVQGDVQRAADVDRAVSECETVIHLAAGAPKDWDGYRQLFVDGLANVAESVRRLGTRRLFFASSIASLYLGDLRNRVRDDEPTDARFEERCHYARAKVLCEQLLDKMRSEFGIPCVIFRPGIVVGAGSLPQHLGVGEWPSETMCIRWGRDVSSELPFVLVDDVVDAFLCAMNVSIDQIAGKKFNLIGDVRPSAREYINLLRKETSRDFRIVPQSVTWWATIEFAKWFVKVCARKPENTRLTWRELSYRTAASSVDCVQTKRMLNWQPTADSEDFVERGIRAALIEDTSL